MNTIKSLYALSVVLMLTAQVANAEQQRGGRGKPPQVALDACSNVSEGNACQFEGRRGDSLTGTCTTVKSGDLACVPEGHRPPREGGDQESRSDEFS